MACFSVVYGVVCVAVRHCVPVCVTVRRWGLPARRRGGKTVPQNVISEKFVNFAFCLQNNFLNANLSNSFNSPLRFWLCEPKMWR